MGGAGARQPSETGAALPSKRSSARHPASFAGRGDAVGHPLQEAGEQAGAGVRVVDQRAGCFHAGAMLREIARELFRCVVGAFHVVHFRTSSVRVEAVPRLDRLYWGRRGLTAPFFLFAPKPRPPPPLLYLTSRPLSLL